MKYLFLFVFLVSNSVFANTKSDELIDILQRNKPYEDEVSYQDIERALSIITIAYPSQTRGKIHQQLRQQVLDDGVYDGMVIPGLYAIKDLIERGDIVSANFMAASLGTIDHEVGSFIHDQFALSGNMQELENFTLDLEGRAFGNGDFPSINSLNLSSLRDNSANAGGSFSWDDFSNHLPSVSSCSAGCDRHKGKGEKLGLAVGLVGGFISGGPLNAIIAGATLSGIGQGVACAAGCGKYMYRDVVDSFDESNDSTNNDPANTVADAQTNYDEGDDQGQDDDQTQGSNQGQNNVSSQGNNQGQDDDSNQGDDNKPSKDDLDDSNSGSSYVVQGPDGERGIDPRERVQLILKSLKKIAKAKNFETPLGGEYDEDGRRTKTKNEVMLEELKKRGVGIGGGRGSGEPLIDRLDREMTEAERVRRLIRSGYYSNGKFERPEDKWESEELRVINFVPNNG